MQASRIYRALLRCYPAPFRREYGAQMQLAFSDQLAQAREAGPGARAALWVRELTDTVRVAPVEHWHVLSHDLRYALRAMAAKPGFASIAVLSLALGIGANTAIFSLWNGVLHASLPMVECPGELVMLTNPDESGSWTGRWDPRTDGPRAWVTYAEFEQLRDRGDRFSMLMASQSSLGTMQLRVGGGETEEARGRLVSGAFFDVLGVEAAIGRLFSTAGDRTETFDAVLSHAYWQQRFGGRPDALGTTLHVRNATVTVIGVTPPGFIGETSGQQPDFWLPLRLQPRVLPGSDKLHDTPPAKSMWLHVFGRLKPGVALAEAEGQANAILQADLASFYGNVSGAAARDYREERLQLRRAARGASPTRSEFSESLTALLAGVGVLLLIACANLANLLLARGEARRAEIAVRLSLGASRSRLVRQLVTESLVLACAGGLAAVAVAYALHGALVRMLTEYSATFQMAFAPNPAVLAFLVAATVGAALLVGVLPAWQLTRGGTADTLKEQGRGAAGARGLTRSGRGLVTVQLALSLPLLVGAGLMARTVYNLQRADLGYSTERLLLARVDLTDLPADAARRSAVREALRERLGRLPGVTSVSYSQLGLFTGGFSNTTVEVEGHTPTGDRDPDSAVDVVGPGYFSTLEAPLILGRGIEDADRGDGLKVCVINAAFARRFFEGRHPIGRRVTAIDNDVRTSYQVVGVARDLRTDALRGEIGPRYYVSAEQPPHNPGSPTFLVRTAGPAPVAAVREAIADLDAAVSVMSTRTLEHRVAALTAQDRASAWLSVVFGVVALALAAIGLYGVLSYSVARRTSEIAVRMALGAAGRRVIAMILRETLGVVLVGLIAGVLLAFGATELVSNRLVGVAPQDPLTVSVAILLLVGVAVAAAFFPALRASRVDPMTALRQQ